MRERGSTPKMRREDDRRAWVPEGTETVRLAELDVHVCTLRQATGDIGQLVGDGQVHLIATVNVDQSLHVRDDPHVLSAFRGASRRYADGQPIVWLARLRGVRLPGRVTGADLLPALCSQAARSGHRVAFVGGAPGVGSEAARRLGLANPGLQVVLTASPPVGFDADETEDTALVQSLWDVAPDLVFVGIGCPRQELWVDRRRQLLPPAVYLGVGGSLDFAAGRTTRAPMWWRRVGLEWLHRLLHDWRRLWRRYLVNDVRFVAVLLGSVPAAVRRRARRG